MLSNETVLNLVKRHTFAKPAAPPTPRASTLGLDRLALEKRALSSQEEERKRRRVDNQEPHFKGMHVLPSYNINLSNQRTVPSLPASRTSNARKRAEETPSHPGGLSAEGREVLEAHRRRRDHHRGELASVPFALLPNVPQRASRRIKKRKEAARVASTTFNVVPIATVTALGGGTIIEVGKQHPAPSAPLLVTTLPAYVFRTLDGIPHRVIRMAAVVADGAARVPELGMRRPHERREILALTKDSWSSTSGSGRKSKYASIETGICLQKRAP